MKPRLDVFQVRNPDDTVDLWCDQCGAAFPLGSNTTLAMLIETASLHVCERLADNYAGVRTLSDGMRAEIEKEVRMLRDRSGRPNYNHGQPPSYADMLIAMWDHIQDHR